MIRYWQQIVLLTRQDKKVWKNIKESKEPSLSRRFNQPKIVLTKKDQKVWIKVNQRKRNQLVWIIIHIFLYSYFSLFNLYLIVLRYFCFITLFRTMIRICFDVFDSTSRQCQIFNFQDIFVSSHCSSSSNDKISFKRHKFKVFLKSRKCRFDIILTSMIWRRRFNVTWT